MLERVGREVLPSGSVAHRTAACPGEDCGVAGVKKGVGLAEGGGRRGEQDSKN
jgi:hypothetical protein